MRTATTSPQDQRSIERGSTISIRVTLIVLLYSAKTISKCFTFAKNKKPFKTVKDRDPEIFNAANFQTLTRSKKAAKDWDPEICNAANLKTVNSKTHKIKKQENFFAC